jgi:restriction endonuclease S subunit
VTSFSEVTEKRIDPYYHQNYFINAFNALENSKYTIDTLKNISKKITSGITPLSGGDSYTNEFDGIPFIRSGNIDINGELNFGDLLYIKPEVHNTTMKSSQVEYGDLMIAIVGATIGQVGVYLYERPANINQAIALVRLNQEIDFQYIKELIKSSIGQLSLARLKRPVARANINLEEIATIKVILPPIAKQIEIASYIANLRQQAKQLYLEGEQSIGKARLEIEQLILGE